MNTDQHHKEFFDNVKIPYKRSARDVLDQLESTIDFNEKPKSLKSIPMFVRYSVAAAVLLLLGFGTFIRFYTVTVKNPTGKHVTIALPDGSAVELNAASSLAYKPYWWKYSRELNFEGEGYFNVEKGKRFAVRSNMATTEVLGTSFNIYARSDRYEVVCVSGQVKVTSVNQDEAVLTSGYEAKLSLDGKVVIYKSENAENVIAWRDNKFFFTAIPLPRVFEEIERQYNVEIVIPEGIKRYYTGYFTRDKSIEEVLELVCKPFGINFIKVDDKKFTIIAK